MAQDVALSGDQRTVPSPLSRHVRQAGLCLMGAGFMAASIAVSRRSVIRLRAATIPPFYTSNRSPISRNDSADRGLLAARALGLATLNVVSFGVMLVGGISWAFDLSSVAELRDRTRAQLMKPSDLSKEDEEEMERQLEKMLDTVYSKFGMTRPGADPENQDPGSVEGNDGEE